MSSIVNGPINPDNGLPRRWHKHILKVGIADWFSGPPHFWHHKGPESVRGDSRALFNQLVMSLSNSELINKRDQLVETYSHYMNEVEIALDREYSYDRMIAESKTVERDVYARWQQNKWQKKRMWAIAEMDRLGPVICLITNHVNAVTAGDASPIEDAVLPLD